MLFLAMGSGGDDDDDDGGFLRDDDNDDGGLGAVALGFNWETRIVERSSELKFLRNLSEGA